MKTKAFTEFFPGLDVAFCLFVLSLMLIFSTLKHDFPASYIKRTQWLDRGKAGAVEFFHFIRQQTSGQKAPVPIPKED